MRERFYAQAQEAAQPLSVYYLLAAYVLHSNILSHYSYDVSCERTHDWVRIQGGWMEEAGVCVPEAIALAAVLRLPPNPHPRFYSHLVMDVRWRG